MSLFRIEVHLIFKLRKIETRRYTINCHEKIFYIWFKAYKYMIKTYIFRWSTRRARWTSLLKLFLFKKNWLLLIMEKIIKHLLFQKLKSSFVIFRVYRRSPCNFEHFQIKKIQFKETKHFAKFVSNCTIKKTLTRLLGKMEIYVFCFFLG